MVADLLTSVAFFLGFGAARQSPGTVVDQNPLVVIYLENWGAWLREFGASNIERNILSRSMPARNIIINYSFFSWNPGSCELVQTDTVDVSKGDPTCTTVLGQQVTTGCSIWPGDDWNVGQTWAQNKAPGGLLVGVMKLKTKYPHIKILPSVGGWSRSGTYHDCLNSKRDVMINSIVDWITVFGFDGIDFDWEYPNCDGKPCGCQNEAVCLSQTGFSNKAGPNDWDNYKRFVKMTRLALNDLEDKVGKRLYITAALGINPKLLDGENDVWSKPTPIEWMCEEDDFDWLNLMTYDLYGPWDKLTGPLAPLYHNPVGPTDQMSIDDSLKRIFERCKKPWKLTMGLATYGKTWQDVPKGNGVVPGLWQASTNSDPRAGGTWEMGTVSFWDTASIIRTSSGCKRTWDDVSKTPTLYCDQLPENEETAKRLALDSNSNVKRGQKNVFISYEDGESWKEKMKYAREHQMGGAIIWAASDTGNGAWAQDVTEELFNGLFTGWTGREVKVNSANPQKDPLPTGKRWDHYPCPGLSEKYMKDGSTTIIENKCDNLSYPPYKTSYYNFDEYNGNIIEIGKEKILVVQPNQPSTPTNPVTQPPAPTNPVTQPPAPTNPVTQPPAPVNPVTQPPAPVNPVTQPPAPTNPVIQPPAPSDDPVEQCEKIMIGQSRSWDDTCKNYCKFYGPGSPWAQMCLNNSDGENLASCIEKLHTFCRTTV